MTETVRGSRAHLAKTADLRGPLRLAIIGAGEFQVPLIEAARKRGIETHVFAWADGAAGKEVADFFYPVSITEIDEIAAQCAALEVDGVATIGSDLANITVAEVAERLGLPANSVDCVRKSTNKELMRAVFEQCGDPSPRSVPVREGDDAALLDVPYPLIVKPADRSGSRGITKLADPVGLVEAVERAMTESFAREALVEEFAEGDEYSVEYVSWEGEHRFLAVTEKFTTGAPAFIERGHLEPARISAERERAIRTVVEHALDSLGVRFGASHAEVKVAPDETIKIIEIGSRMGGDCIGSHLVPASTGYDFVGAVIDTALGVEPPCPSGVPVRHVAIRFVFDDDDRAALAALRRDPAVELLLETPIDEDGHAIVDSGSRYGFYIFASDDEAALEPYLPASSKEAC